MTTPSTAVSDRGTSETWSGSGMISRTRSSGRAYSCSPKVEADQRQLAPAVRGRGRSAMPQPESQTASRRARPADAEPGELVANSRCGFNILTVLSPSAPLTTPASKSRIDRPGPGIVRSRPGSAASGQKVVDPIDNKPDGSAMIGHDHPRRVRPAGHPENRSKRLRLDHRQDRAPQIGEARAGFAGRAACGRGPAAE